VRDTVLLELPLAPTCAGTGGEPCASVGDLGGEGADGDADDPDPDPADPRWAALSELEL